MFAYSSAPVPRWPEEKIYALVDRALDAQIYQRIAFGLDDVSHVTLFRGTFAGDIEQYSPILIDLDNVAAYRPAYLQNLLGICAGKPLLSFIAAPAGVPLGLLANHLRQLLRIKTADDQVFLLRYADNRMLPAFYSVLDETQQHAFLGPIGMWVVADHRGQVLELSPPRTAAPIVLPEHYPLQLDDQQLALLLERTAIHSTIAQLEQIHELFVRDFSIAERICFAERNSRYASEQGFERDEDKATWCNAALRAGEQYYRHPRIVPVIRQARDSAMRLSDAFMSLSQQDWDAIQAEHR